VVRAVSLTRLPRAPAIVEGAINLRGAVVPVLDIRARFRLAPRQVAPADHLVVAWAGERLVALRADRALDLTRFEPGDVEDARAALPEVGYVSGVAKLSDGLLLIHDLATFLSEAEAEDLDEALAPTGEAPREGDV
jgi:purine-binding chemotaxis protein CheW